MEITRRALLKLFTALPFLRHKPASPEPCAFAFPLVFPDGLDGKGEPHLFYLALVKK